MSECLRLVRHGDRVDLILDRPERRNALDEQLIADLRDAVRRVGDEEESRFLVLRGAGKAFCAGADLEYMRKLADADAETNLRDAEALGDLFRAVYECPKPVVAAVHGAAIGGGLGLVAAADIAVCTPDTKFGFTETRLGIVPGVISPFAVRRIGVAACRRLFLTAEIFDGEQAHRLGLIDHLADASQLDDLVATRIAALRVGGPKAQGAAKRLLGEIAELSVAEAMQVTPRHIAEQRATEEAKEGFAAFFEKRAPSWVEEKGE